MDIDWAADVKRYVPGASDDVIKKLVRYCGIALQKKDSSLVAFSDPKETDRVRQNFLKKKLALTDADDVLDAAIAKVGELMKADRNKNRVTVYYLLAEHFGLLSVFGGVAGTVGAGAAAAGALGLASLGGDAGGDKSADDNSGGSTGAAVAAAAGGAVAAVGGAAAAVGTGAAKLAGGAADVVSAGVDKVGDGVSAGAAAVGGAAAAVGAGVSGAVGAGAAAVGGAAAALGAGVSGLANAVTDGPPGGNDSDEKSGCGWLWWLLGLLLLALLLWWLFCREAAPAPDANAGAATTEAAADPAAAASGDANAVASAPAEGSVKIPDGAGVTSELRDGKPVAKVYFDTGKTAVVPAFTATAAGLKAYLESNAGSSLAVSGFNDPSGNAARNAELSKNRAQAVKAALVAAGIPEASVAMVKPESSTDAAASLEGARRVEVVVR